MIYVRIPKNKLYRAFSELDSFSDEQCERFVQRVRITGTYWPLVVVAVGLLSITSLFVVALSAFDLTKDMHRSLWLQFGRQTADTLALAIWLVPSVVIPPFVGIVTRDIVLRLYLRHAVRMQIERVMCRSCKYLLIGQRVAAGRVTCPECGEGNALSTLGVTEEDLVPPERGEDRLADMPAA